MSCGILARRAYASTLADAPVYVDGSLFFQGPSELGLMRGGARELLDPLGKKGFDPKTKTLY